MNKELIQQARQTNLANYLISLGTPLKQEGKRYRHKEHNSLIFTENTYFWNSRQEKGNAIDYLVNHMNMTFVDSVLALTSTSTNEKNYISPVTRPPTAPAKGFVLDDSSLNPNLHKAKSYLTETRKIEENIINFLIEKNLILQEKQTNNIIFLMCDENNNPVGAELQGVTKKRFKGIMKNSKYGYGFNVKFSDSNIFDYALFFESAIDLISFIDYKQNHQNKSLENCIILVSMGGLKKNVVKHTLKAFKCDKVVLCVDNDEAGRKFKDEIEGVGIEFLQHSPDVKYKDWNEQLMAVKQLSKPVGRLLVYGIESCGEGTIKPTEKVNITRKTRRKNVLSSDKTKFVQLRLDDR